MPTAKLSSTSLYYEQYGQGPNLIMISGLSADHSTWKPLLPRLVNDYKVTLFDNRGAGQSEAPKGPYTTKQMADDVIELVDNLDIEHFFLIGHSLGSNITQQLLISIPERINKAILLCAKTASSSAGRMYYDKINQLLAENASQEELLRYKLTFLLSQGFLQRPNALEELIRLIQSNPHPQSKDAYHWQLHATVEFVSNPTALEKVNIPVLCIAGEEDQLNSPAENQKLAKLLPLGEYTSLKNCGHIPQIEQIKQLVSMIRAFFR